MFIKFKKILISTFLVSVVITSCIFASDKKTFNDISQLNDSSIDIGTQTDGIGPMISKEIFPKANSQVYIDDPNGILALVEGKIDGYITDELVVNYAKKVSNLDIDILGYTGYVMDIAIGVSKNPEIVDAKKIINEFLNEMKENGILDDMLKRWTIDFDDNMPDIEEPINPTRKISIGTTGLVAPFTYYKGDNLNGFDIELIKRFALYMNAEIDIQVYDWISIIPALTSGKIDYIFSDLYITEESKEVIDYSNVIYKNPMVVCVEKDRINKANLEYNSLEELEGKRIAVSVGSIQEKYAKQYIKEPEIIYLDDYSEMALALVENKADAFIVDKVNLHEVKKVVNGIEELQKPLAENEMVAAVSKEKPDLYDKVNEFIEKRKNDGTIDSIISRWENGDESQYIIRDFSDLPDINGKLKLGVSAQLIPYSFVYNGNVVGIDIDIVYEFCKEYGYAASYENTKLASLLAGISTGAYDLIFNGLAWSKERAEMALLTKPYAKSIQVVVVRQLSSNTNDKINIFTNIKDGFYRNIIDEGRWKLILSGLLCTILITLASAFFGTIFGFILCAIKKYSFEIAKKIVITFEKLVQGLPIVVILMILYYVVFSKSDISAMIVGIIGFSITFGVCVSGILSAGIDTVDIGQIEASKALAISGLNTFIIIVLPQAIKNALPIYKGELVSMLKLTSVVGYIAVQDITKVSDIIRARTFDAFFPLLFTAFIYLILSYILIHLLEKIEITVDYRKNKNVLKGINTSNDTITTFDNNKNVSDASENNKINKEKEVVVSINHLKKTYGDVTPIIDVNTSVYRDDVIAIIGPSGTGKSTLLRCINGLETPTSGEICVGDLKVNDENIVSIREKVGMVFQSFNLFPHMTVIENVMLAPMIVKKQGKQEAYDNAMSLIRKLGLAEKILNYPNELSGGQKQRVAIARALAMEPEIILFDEPTSALDPNMTSQVGKIIKALSKLDFTMMIVTHEMKFAQNVANRVFYLDKGTILEDGNPDQVFLNPIHEETKNFINKKKAFNYNITSANFDFMEFMIGVVAWAKKGFFARKIYERLIHVIEEIVVEALLKEGNMSMPANVTITQNDDAEIYITLNYHGTKKDIIDNFDDISRKIFENMISDVKYSYDNKNIIEITIK